MSYDLYIVTADNAVESVFNCSAFNMRPFIAANIKVLSHQLRVLESQRSVAQSSRSNACSPLYVQDNPYSGEVSLSDIIYYDNVVSDFNEQIQDVERCITAWVGLEQGEKVSYTDLCMLFSFNIENEWLQDNEKYYARQMIRSLVDCARFHGDIQAYYA